MSVTAGFHVVPVVGVVTGVVTGAVTGVVTEVASGTVTGNVIGTAGVTTASGTGLTTAGVAGVLSPPPPQAQSADATENRARAVRHVEICMNGWIAANAAMFT